MKNKRKHFKKIVSMKDVELSVEMTSLKESMSGKFDKLISEETDSCVD